MRHIAHVQSLSQCLIERSQNKQIPEICIKAWIYNMINTLPHRLIFTPGDVTLAKPSPPASSLISSQQPSRVYSPEKCMCSYLHCIVDNWHT